MAVQIERNNLIGDGVFYVEKNNAINYVPLVIVEISGVLEVVQFDPPTNIRETGDSESSVTWEWTAAKHATEYQYQTRLGALGRWSAESVVTGTSVTITSLASDSSYDIRVRSKNSTLLGAWSSPVSGTTDVAVPPPVTDPVTPSTPRETADSSDSITWEWSSHSENTGGHEWGLRTGGGNAFRSSSQSSNRLTTDNLTPSATYQLRVRGLRHGRRSAWSAWGTGTTALASSEPEPEQQPITPPVTTPTTQTNPVTPTNLRVTEDTSSVIQWSWTQNARNTGGYEWEFRSGTSGDATNSGSTTSNNVERSNLSPSSTYQFRVRGIRGSAKSGWTAWVSGTTSAQALGKVIRIKFASSTTSSISITWDSVALADSYEYQVRGYYLDSGYQGGVIVVNGTSATIINLPDPCTRYAIRIRARRQGSKGPWTNWNDVGYFTAASAPEVPTNFSFAFTHPGGTSVSIRVGARFSPCVTRFGIQHRLMGSSRWIRGSQRIGSASTKYRTHSTILLQDGRTGHSNFAQAGEVYEVQLLAITSSGTSNWSSTQTFTVT